MDINTLLLTEVYSLLRGFPKGARGKEPACQVGDLRDPSSILGWKDTLEERIATPWTEEPGGPLFTGLQRVRHN